MVRPSIDVGVNAGGDFVQFPPSHDIVHEPVTSAVGQVVLCVSEPTQVVQIIGQAEVVLSVAASDGTSPFRACLQNYRLFRRE